MQSFSIKEKGKGKAKASITDEEDEKIKELLKRTQEAMTIIKSYRNSHPQLDDVINQALTGNTWYQKPKDCSNDLWLHDIGFLKLQENIKNEATYHSHRKWTTRDINPGSVLNRSLNRKPLADKEICIFLKGVGWVKHTKEAPVWQIPRYCYLAIINDAGLQHERWPAYPTVYEVSHFHYKWRKHNTFKVEDTIDGHYHIHLCNKSAESGWLRIDKLANSSQPYKCVGGKGLTSSIKTLDGTNYQEWAQKIEAYLRTQELWQYVNRTSVRPIVPPKPVIPIDATGTPYGKTTSQMVAYRAAVDAYNTAFTTTGTWDIQDGKAMGIIQLKMNDSLQYLKQNYSRETWDNIYNQFATPGAAALFVDYKAAQNFVMTDKKDPSVQIAELNMIINHLAVKGFRLDDKIQALIILSLLPNSWDGILSTILENHAAKDLTIALIMPIIQEEWHRCRARSSRGKNKLAHFTKQNLCQGPNCQQWQGQQGNNYQNNNYAPNNKQDPPTIIEDLLLTKNLVKNQTTIRDRIIRTLIWVLILTLILDLIGPRIDKIA
jgi:hypothetical protein